MSKSRAPSSQTRVLLDLLSQRRHWLHGYELSEHTGLKSGTLYPILIRLSDRGLLEAKWEPSEFAGRPPRRLYRLTAQGATFAATHCAEERDIPEHFAIAESRMSGEASRAVFRSRLSSLTLRLLPPHRKDWGAADDERAGLHRDHAPPQPPGSGVASGRRCWNASPMNWRSNA